MEGAAIQMLASLLVVVATIGLARVVLGMTRWAPGAGSRRSLRVTETCALGGRQRLHVVEVDGERLLLGSSEQSVRLLRRLGPAAPPEPRPEGLRGIGSASALRAAARRGLRRLRLAAPVAAVGLVLLARAAAAAPPADAASDLVAGLASGLGDAADPDRLHSTLQIVLLVTLVSVAPSILLMATCFTRVLIVLAFLRQAIGIQQLPPNQVLAGLALFVTLFVMAPVGQRIQAEALTPYMEREIGDGVAVERALSPVREFLVQFTRENDLELFGSLAGVELPEDEGEIPLSMLLPAYMLSELRTAFEIGFMIYLPFLVIDLVVASMLISMGMIVLPPIVISLPFKLMLFVLLDGWNLVVGSLVAGLR